MGGPITDCGVRCGVGVEASNRKSNTEREPEAGAREGRERENQKQIFFVCVVMNNQISRNYFFLIL